MANVARKQQGTLEAAEGQYMKTKYFYDAFGRNTYIVQAPRKAKQGEKCLVTKFTYEDDDAVDIDVSFEYPGTWDASWDVAETTPA